MSDKVGVHIAVVRNNRFDSQGRIEVALEGASSLAGAYPARLSTLHAGNGFGVQFLPETGDQVLVAFVNGYPDELVVLGGLWSSVDKPPEANANGNNDVKIIKTRSGNTIRLVDTDGSEAIEVSDSAGNTLTFKPQDKRISIEAVDQLQLKAASIHIEATGGDLVLKGGPNVKIN